MRTILLYLFITSYISVYAEQHDVKSLVSASLANSPYIDAKNLQIKATGLMVDQARLWGNPTVSGDFGAITQNDISGFSYTFRISQPVFFPGKQKLRASLAAHNQQFEMLNLRERKQLIQFNVIQSAYRYKLTEDMLQEFQARLNRFKMLRSAIAAKPAASPEIRAQKYIIENALRNSERDYFNLQKELAIALENLRVYLNQAETPSLALPLFSENPGLDRQAVLTEVLANNLLIQKIGVQVAQAETNATLLNREAYPDINIAAYYDKDTGPFQEHRFGGGLSLPIPLFNRNQHAAAAADDYALAARKEREYALNILKRDFNSVFEEYLVSLRLIEKFPIGEVKQTNRNLQSLTAEFMRSRLATLTYADAEQRMQDSIVSAYTAQMAYVNAVLQIALFRGSDDFAAYFSK